MMYALTGEPSSANGRRDNIWDLVTGKDVSSFPVESFSDRTNSPLVVALSPNGVRIAAVAQVRVTPAGTRPVVTHYILRLWDLRTGGDLGTMEYADPVRGLFYSPDSEMLAVVHDDFTKIVNATTGNELVTLSDSGAITALAFSHNGATVAAGLRSGVARAWKVLDGQKYIRMLISHPSQLIKCCSMLADGRLLAQSLAMERYSTSTASQAQRKTGL